MKSFSTARRLKIWLRNNDARAIYQPDNIKQSTERTDDFEDVANEFACKYQGFFIFFVNFHSQRLKHHLYIVELNAVEVKSLDS